MEQKRRKESPIPCGKCSPEYLDVKRKIANGLERKHLKLIQFLCADYIPRSVELTSGLDFMHYLEKAEFIGQHDVSFLIEILFQIQRYDLIKVIPGIPDRSYFENEILSGLHAFEGQKYRNFAVQLENQLSKDDLKDFKSHCIEFAQSPSLDRAEYVVDILQKLEELDLVHGDNFSSLLMILQKLKEKGPYQELKRIQSNRDGNTDQDQEENSGADAEIPIEPGVDNNSLTATEDTSSSDREVPVENKRFSSPDYEFPEASTHNIGVQSETSMLSTTPPCLSDEFLISGEHQNHVEIQDLEERSAEETEICSPSRFSQPQCYSDKELATEDEQTETATEQSTITENISPENMKTNQISINGILSEELNYGPKAVEQLDQGFWHSGKNPQERPVENAEAKHFQDEHVKMKTEHTSPFILKPESEAIFTRNRLTKPVAGPNSAKGGKIRELLKENAETKHSQDEHIMKIKIVSSNAEHTFPLMSEPESQSSAASNIYSISECFSSKGAKMHERTKENAEMKCFQQEERLRIGTTTMNSEPASLLTTQHDASSIRAVSGSKSVQTLAVVINEKDFPRYRPASEEIELWEQCGLSLPLLDLLERVGSDCDVNKLSHMLKNCEGVDICPYDNLSTSDLLKLLKEISQGLVKRGKHRNLAKYDRLLLFILTHGEAGFIYGVDGLRIALSEVLDIFSTKNCPILANKPKVIFPIACRFGSLSRKLCVEYSRLRQIFETENNLMVIYPTQLFQGSYRWTKEGTVFVTEFVKALEEYHGERDLNSIVKVVRDRISVEYRGQQVPEFWGCLAEEFCLRFEHIDDMEVADAVGRTQNE